MVGDSMDLDPRDLLIFLDVIHDFLFFLAVRHCLFVAVLANFNIGNGGFLMGKYLGVAVKTGKPCLFNMLLMVILDGLGESG